MHLGGEPGHVKARPGGAQVEWPSLLPGRGHVAGACHGPDEGEYAVGHADGADVPAVVADDVQPRFILRGVEHVVEGDA